MDGLQWFQTLLKWMIWGVKTTPIFGSTPKWGQNSVPERRLKGWIHTWYPKANQNSWHRYQKVGYPP